MIDDSVIEEFRKEIIDAQNELRNENFDIKAMKKYTKRVNLLIERMENTIHGAEEVMKMLTKNW